MKFCLLIFALLAWSCIALATESSPVKDFISKDEIFYQAESRRFTFKGTQLADWEQLPFSEPIAQVAIGDEKESFFLLTSKGALYKWRDGTSFQRIDPQLGIKLTPGSVIRKSKGISPLVVATQASAYRCNLALTYCNSTQFAIGSVNDLFVSKNGDAYLGGSDGLFVWKNGVKTVSQIPQVQSSIESVTFDESSGSPVAGWDLMWRQVNKKKLWHFFRTPGIIDGNVTAMDFDENGTLWIGNSICLNLQRPDLTFRRVGFQEGLITDNITTIAANPAFGSVWIGTMQGAMRYHRGHWRYYYGPRWLPSKNFDAGQNVNSIAVIDSTVDSAVISTDMGLAIIRWNAWTLEKKGEHYQKMVYPRHDRYGLCADVDLGKFGDVSTWRPTPSDNDGLWTSIYLASQVFRYATTKDPEVKREAWHAFSALDFLNNITGITGLMGRSFDTAVNPPPVPWHISTVYPGWMWKGTTSSDEVVGHLFVYPLVHDLLAEAPEEKERAYRLVNAITSYIVDNDFYLIDIDGKHTQWGVWNPSYLNDRPDWYDERGLNALQILSWLLSASRITGNPKFMNAYNNLTENYGYDINVINQKITQPSDDNYSDDELAWLPYYTYIFANPKVLQNEIKISLDRAFDTVRSEKPSLWNMIYGAAGHSYNLEDALFTLRTWPLSQIDWPTQNSKRFDIQIDPDADREGQVQSLNLLPYDELNVLRWNSNPFELDGGSGYNECDPSAWLLPYWMGRYHGFIR